MTTSRPKPRKRKARVSRENNSIIGEDNALDHDGDTFVVKNKRAMLHSLRRDQLQRVLDPLLSRSSSTLLLCSGQEDRCRIIPVRISDSADSAAQWNETRHAWNQQNAIWRSWFPWYGVKNIVVGEVRLCPLVADRTHFLILIRSK